MNQKVMIFKTDRISPDINGDFYIKSVVRNQTFGMNRGQEW